MQKHFIYFVTDANRTMIQTDLCENITQRIMELQEASTRAVFGQAKLWRVVYVEEFSSLELAQRRRLELTAYTHMMKERLIRRQNPNWISIGCTTTSVTKKPLLMHSA